MKQEKTNNIKKTYALLTLLNNEDRIRILLSIRHRGLTEKELQILLSKGFWRKPRNIYSLRIDLRILEQWELIKKVGSSIMLTDYGGIILQALEDNESLEDVI